MTEIEKTWFTAKTKCPDSTTSISSNSLGLDSFKGLFFIAGAAAGFALLHFMIMFVKRNRHVVTSSSGSLREKIAALGRRFYEGDLKSHTFRRARLRDGSMDDGVNEIAPIETLENTNSPPNLSSASSQIHGVLTNEQGTPSAEQELPNRGDEGSLEVPINVELTSVN
ncbi:hypothetical protein BT93_C0916 [Corymbia citriodora subsp. variegata]|nr:hypothetical protein BT93_C0916 [Corymbia citriodora subsp. variegata]